MDNVNTQNDGAGIAPVTEEVTDTATVSETETAPAATEATEADVTTDAPAEPIADVVAEPAPVEEHGDQPGDETVQRDPATPVAEGEELSETDRVARADYVVDHPEDRTVYDPYPADGKKPSNGQGPSGEAE